MITLSTIGDYWMMLGWAAVFGGVGGLVFELLQHRGPGDGSGRLENPGRYLRERLTDLGWVASCIIGAASAVAVLYFFPPTITIEGSESTSTEYDLVALVALSIIVGSGGPGVFALAQQTVQQQLTAAAGKQQAEATAAMGQQQLQTKVTEAQHYVEQLGDTAKSEAENAIKSALIQYVAPALNQASGEEARQPDEAEKRVQGMLEATLEPLTKHVDSQVSAAKEALATPPRQA